MFSFSEKKGEKEKGFQGELARRKLEKEREKESKLIRLASDLKKIGIEINCMKCKKREKCQDKYANLIIGNGSSKAFFNYHSKTKDPYSCCETLIKTMQNLDSLYQEREDIREIYKKIRTQSIF
ncbi:MAG: hypothetical protein ACOC3Z_00855 [Nanoarchaeota archaeon]